MNCHCLRVVGSLLVAVLILGLDACRRVDADGRALSQYEHPATKALVLEMLRQMPKPAPGVPRSHALTLGEIVRGRDFTACSVSFMQELAKASGMRFISAEVITTTLPDHHAIDPDTRVPVYVLQVRQMQQTASKIWEFEAAWAYKKTVERRRWRVSGDDQSGWKAEPLEIIRDR